MESNNAISGTNAVGDGSGANWEIYTGTCTPDAIPGPGAVVLAGFGAGLVGSLRRQRTL